MRENELSYAIRGAAFNVYNRLGPGLFESVYEAVLAYELRKSGLYVQTQVPLPVIYEQERFDLGFRVDMIIEQKVIVEIKSVVALTPVHHKQLLTYLKLTDLKLGALDKLQY